MMAPGQGVLRLEVTGVAFGGDGIARHEGRVVFVPLTAPGDIVDARVVEERKGFLRAEVEAVITPSPDRGEPACRHFGRCGGCCYQHIRYPAQLAIKERQVRETLARIGKIADPPVAAIVPSPEPYGYRNRIAVHAGGGVVGFWSRDGATLVDVERCPIASDGVNARLAELRARAPSEGHFSLREAGLPRSGFAQSNRFLRAALRDTVARALAPGGERLFEGFCGSGFFTEVLAGIFGTIEACDVDARLLRDVPKLPNITWRQGTAEEWLARTRAEAVLLDPPREGLSRGVIEALLKRTPGRLVYVSCDPSTLARDAARLAGALRLESVQPIDLFPQTAQIECVAVFRARGAAGT